MPKPLDIDRTRAIVHEFSVSSIESLPDGTLFPRQASVTLTPPTGGHSVALVLEVEDGRPVVSRLDITRRSDAPPITVSAVRALALQPLIDLGIAVVADSAADIWRAYQLNGGLRPVPPTVPLPRMLSPEESDAIQRAAIASQRGRPVTEETLRRVARIVEENDYDPRRQIRDEIGCSSRTASRWIAEARRRGLIKEESK